MFNIIRKSKYSLSDTKILALHERDLRVVPIVNKLGVPDWYVRKVLYLNNCTTTVERTSDLKDKGYAKKTSGKRAHNFRDLTGIRFGKLTAIRLHTIKKGKISYWLCECECGNKAIARTSHLTQGARIGCGCTRAVNAGRKANPQKTYNTVIASYRTSALRRGIEFKLSDKLFIKTITSNCYYCGDAPSLRTFRQGKQKILVNGIDRKDCEKGYVVSNIVPCCTSCNYMKSNQSIDDFFMRIERIYDRFFLS